MTNETKLVDYLKRVTADLYQTRQRLQDVEDSAHEPVAVVGMGCRFPGGAASPQELWELVAQGRDAVSEFPTNRGWDLPGLYHPDPDHPGTSYTRSGGFLHDADQFDADFFNISRREAQAMDPQQRLLLEVAWEALEDSGIDPHAMAATDTGVFTGVSAHDYGPRATQAPEEYQGYVMSGSSGSVASGRIAYTLGLQGPTMTVDTACSSSLVAVHLACQAIRNGECDMALAGGAAVLPTPAVFLEFSRQRGLAADGRCKAFAAEADGTGWAEGAGIIVLQRLSDAQAQGRTVLAVIAGSAVNQDGASSRLTAPNGPAQERVIRQALANARLTADQIDAVEAHGTGTTLGDPIEAHALLNTYGQHHTAQQPLYLGSLKSNIGHTQAAAGIGGIIKMVQALQHGQLPPTLHADNPSPHIDWTTGHISLLTKTTPWPEQDRPRNAAVSAFGVSGTNAHLILQQAPVPEPAEGGGDTEPAVLPPGPVPLTLSGRTAPALAAQARRLHQHLTDHPDLDLPPTAHALAARPVFPHRAVIAAADRGEALAALAALAEGSPHALLTSGHATTGPGERSTGRTVFVFPGQGSQYPGMTRELLAASPGFRRAVEECEEALSPYVDWSLLEVLEEHPDAPGLDRVDVVQPVLFAVMVALARHWLESGVRPHAVIGHSQGEIAAAHIAGALSLADAARIVALRSRALTTLEGRGGMASLPLAADEVREILTAWPDQLTVAAVNGPAHTVVAGDAPALQEFLDHCTERDIDARRIKVSYASHSHHIDTLREELHRALDTVTPRSGDIPFHSTVTAGPLDTRELTPSYWWRNLRRTVRFQDTLRELLATGHHTFVEISPHPVLTPAVQDTADDHASGAQCGVVPLVTGTLHRDQSERHALLTARARLHTHHHTLDWPTTPTPGERVKLPTYAFQRSSYWLTPPLSAQASATAFGQTAASHPLLGAVLDLPDQRSTVFTGQVSLASQPWLGEHTVHGAALLPATAVVDLALHAGAHLACPYVHELTLHAPLTLAEDAAYDIHLLAAEPDEAGVRELTLHSRPHDHDEWTHHATATLAPHPLPDADTPAAPSGPWPPAGATALDMASLYDDLTERGYGYGPLFQGLTAAWRDGEDMYAEVALPRDTLAEGFTTHPALLDAALHALALHPSRVDAEGPALPYSFRGITSLAGPSAPTALRVRLTRTGPRTLTLATSAPDGTPHATISGLTLLPQSSSAHAPLHHVHWTPQPLPPTAVETSETVELTLSEALEALEGQEQPVPAPRHLIVRLTRPGTGHVHPIDHTLLTHALAFLQAWLTDERTSDTHLTLTTHDAVAVTPHGDVAPAHATLWGLVRTAQTEHPHRLTLIDLDTHPGTPATLRRALTLTGSEPQLAIRHGDIHAPRLTRDPAPELTPPPDGAAWRLDLTRKGTFDGVEMVPYERATAPLGDGEVRVAVRAAGLNFRDVIVTLDMVPGQEGVIGEGAGVVTEVGPGVDGLAPGDRVMGMFSQGIGPVAVTERDLLVRMPDTWSFAQAAAAPVAYLTAYEALKGRVRAGESLLVHTATGGVGVAALHLARHWGVEVYATASEPKWPALLDLGIESDRIASSRTLEFEDTFRERTGGRGVDVVLNSLRDKAIDASLRLLADGGRFIEMGKTDIRDAKEVAAAHPGVDYRVYDLTQTRSERIRALLDELAPLFGGGVLLPPKVNTFGIGQARQALRHLSRARHIGKVVLTVPAPPGADGTVLITGGTGVLGALTARHLITEHGVRHLLLASRSGPSADGAAELVADLERLGAHVEIAACDTTDLAAVEALLAGVPDTRPLRAVVHTAGVIEDATVTALSPEQLMTVLRPKADAAWNLHEATRRLDLDAFVLYSSLSGTLGAPGQANYAAGNAYLDALAQHRRSLGLPATSLAWGLWAEHSGMTGHLTEADVAKITRSGFPPLPTEDALSLLDAALVTPEPAPVLARVDTSALLARARNGTLPALLRGFVRTPTGRDGSRGPAGTAAAPIPASGEGSSSQDRLAGLGEAERIEYLLDLVRSTTAAVLAHPDPDLIDTQQSFKHLGFDSLTTVQLRNHLTHTTGLRLPATLAFDHPTPQALATFLDQQLTPQTTTTPTTTTTT
ncbi:SDR family NAD(P)-dependent oxidoreductase, partial [Streptomyces sp. NPDC018586]